MKALALLLITAAVLAAQSDYPKHNIPLGLGGAQPRGDLKPFYDTSFVLGAGYGYRFHRYLQADVGLDTAFGAAGVREFLDSGFGYLRIRDFQYFVPFGGRVIAPLADGRLLISGGAGGAYLRYSERIRQPSDYYQFDCPVCTSRSGWGYYGLFGVNWFLDQGRHFRIGAVTRVYRGHTEGDPVGELSALRTRDRWVNVFGEFGFSF
ncbi:MAG TPA: hypothetical protein VFQ79_13260 [Bryobacteraceae bacterium]|nr:hypothetical protein [Bryobacteraceae bacterium]